MASDHNRVKQDSRSNLIEMTKPGQIVTRGRTSDSLSLASSSSQGAQYLIETSNETTEYTMETYDNEEHKRYGPVSTIPHKFNTVYPNPSTATLTPNVKRKRPRQSTECWQDSNNFIHSKEPWVVKLCFGIVLVVSFTSLVLVVLNVVGIVGPTCACSSNLANTRHDQEGIQPDVSTLFLLKRIDMLEKNISSLILQLNTRFKYGASDESGMVENSSTSSIQRITTEVRQLREKQVQLDSSLNNLKENDKTKSIDIQEMTAKFVGLAVVVSVLSTNDSLIKSKVHDLSVSTVKFKSSLESLKQKDAELDTSLQRAKSVEAFLNSSMNKLKSVDGQLKMKVHMLNTTFMIRKDESSTNNFKRNITTEVRQLREKQIQIDSSLNNLKEKDAQLDTSLQRAKSVEAFLNSSMNQLKSVDGQLKMKVDLLNTTFMRKTNNISGMQGRAGPAGPPGPQGPRGIPDKPGAGNLSQCYHEQKKTEGTSGATANLFVYFTVPKDKVLVGATCSTIRGDETNLSSVTNSRGEKVYSCQCKGESNVHNDSGNQKCFIDVWVCPGTS